MQWRMVTRRGPQASWTIVGDPAQSSWPDPDEARAAMDSMLSHLQRHDVPAVHQLPELGRDLRVRR